METPLNYMGKIAGICWNSDTTNINKNIKRAKSCMKSGHDRIMEYVDVTFIIDKYSARCIRELGRHIVGTTYLQASTRYINYEEFDYYIPFKNENSKKLYDEFMCTVSDTYRELEDECESKEDIANILPLGMDTKIVWKINLRALIHFMNMRMCNRAYKEIRQLCKEIKDLLSNYSDEWKWICDNYFVPKCKSIGYCKEDKCCGIMPKGIEGLKNQAILEFLNQTNVS
jgi:thymidylate synthase (FAD)